MSLSRRDFVQKLSTITALSALINPVVAKNLRDAIEDTALMTDKEIAENENFWRKIRDTFGLSSTMINLNNGGVSPQPIVVQEAVEKYNRLSNEIPSYYMWRILDKGREPIRQRLAKLTDCSAEEIAINRNTSEALETIIFGLELKKGDEIILSKQDYPNMINAYKQRAMRDGIVLKWVSLELPQNNNEDIVQQYESLITSKTKLVHITHVINWTGQILPAKEIVEVAAKKNIETIVDAAHSFAHFDFSIKDLNCDYLGTSLHKWLCAPFGTGMLFVKKEKIKNVYPLLANDNPKSSNIRKFESLGTRSFATEQGIDQAITFHEAIGIKKKQKRLHHLKNYWVNKVKNISNVSINTPQKKNLSCAIANFSIKNRTPIEICNILQNDYAIHASNTRAENISGVRITPHIYTTKSELDILVHAISEIAEKS